MRIKESVTIHANLVEIDGRGILVLGDSGSGKTTVSLELAAVCGAKLLADDSVELWRQASDVFAKAPAATIGRLCRGDSKIEQFAADSVGEGVELFAIVSLPGAADTISAAFGRSFHSMTPTGNSAAVVAQEIESWFRSVAALREEA